MKNNWNELKDIKAPQELKERTLAAAREARKLTNEPLHAVPRHPWGMAKRLLAAACAFGIVLGGTAVYRTHNGTGQTGSAAVADAISHTFGFAAYAADTGELRQPKDSKIVFDTGSGADDPEKGFLLRLSVQGDWREYQNHIRDHRQGHSLPHENRQGYIGRPRRVGALDASGHKPRTRRRGHRDGLGNGPEEGAEQMYADLCWKLDNGFTDAYDPDASYGLWLPSQPETTDDDLQGSWHKAVDGFEGAKLTVTITFTDGSEQTRSMTLHTGKLGVEYKDDTSGPEPYRRSADR